MIAFEESMVEFLRVPDQGSQGGTEQRVWEVVVSNQQQQLHIAQWVLLRGGNVPPLRTVSGTQRRCDTEAEAVQAVAQAVVQAEPPVATYWPLAENG